MYRYVLLNRTSTADQNDNASRTHQREAGLAFGNLLQGLFVKEIYDNVSGSDMERPGIKETLQLVGEGKADLVIFWDVSRSGRDSDALKKFYADVYTAGGKIGLSSQRKVFDTLTDAIKGTHWERTVSEWERLAILERTNDGKFTKMRMGGWLNRVIFGYKLTTILRNGVALKVPVPDPHNAETAREALLRAARGEPFIAIAADFNARNVETQYGRGEWFETTVRDLVDRVDDYAGVPFERTVTVHGVKHAHLYQYPALIERPTQIAIKKRRALKTKRASTVTPFKGVLRCANCTSLAGSPSRRRYKNGVLAFKLNCSSIIRKQVYARQGRATGFVACDGGTVTSTVLKRQVEALVENIDMYSQINDALYERVNSLKFNKALLDKKRAVAKDLDERERLIGERIIEVGGLPALRTAYEQTKRQRDALEQELSALHLKVVRLEELLAYLGVDESQIDHHISLTEGVVISERVNLVVDKLDEAMADLKLALKDNNWDAVNETMLSLGLELYVDFSLPRPEARYSSLKVAIGTPLR